MIDFTPSAPDKEQVELTFVDTAVRIEKWTEYQVSSHFETPTDGWDLTIAGDQLDDETKASMHVGARVRLTLNGAPQSDGYIDSVEIHASRASGVEYRIQGRDRMGQVVDSCADPTKSFKAAQTLEQAMMELFGPFGWADADHFSISNEGNRNIQTGAVRGMRTSKKRGKPIKSIVLHQLRPTNAEGTFAFAARILQRFGLWAWLTADGERIVIGKADFDQDPLYQLRRYPSGTNVLEGTVRYDIGDQPTIIIADGAGGGGEFGKSQIKSKMVNTAVVTSDPAFAALLERYKGASSVEGPTFSQRTPVPRNRAIFLHDDESHDQAQLDYFVRRKMAELQRRSLHVSYIVEGHGQITEANGLIPWTVDTVVDVDDEVAGLKEKLYVLGRTFVKSRSGGTTTRLDLIRLNTLDYDVPATPDKGPGTLSRPKVTPREMLTFTRDRTMQSFTREEQRDLGGGVTAPRIIS